MNRSLQNSKLLKKLTQTSLHPRQQLHFLQAQQQLKAEIQILNLLQLQCLILKILRVKSLFLFPDGKVSSMQANNIYIVHNVPTRIQRGVRNILSKKNPARKVGLGSNSCSFCIPKPDKQTKAMQDKILVGSSFNHIFFFHLYFF